MVNKPTKITKPYKNISGFLEYKWHQVGSHKFTSYRSAH